VTCPPHTRRRRRRKKLNPRIQPRETPKSHPSPGRDRHTANSRIGSRNRQARAAKHPRAGTRIGRAKIQRPRQDYQRGHDESDTFTHKPGGPVSPTVGKRAPPRLHHPTSGIIAGVEGRGAAAEKKILLVLKNVQQGRVPAWASSAPRSAPWRAVKRKERVLNAAV
jgi:hypothetical protein